LNPLTGEEAKTMDKRYVGLIVIALVLACLAAFGRIMGNGFIHFDDGSYILENSHIQKGVTLESVRWALTSFEAGNWHPLTWLSHMLDWRLFGSRASGHHLMSLLFHIGAVIFLFLFLVKTTRDLWPAAFAAAFFALHPLRVESVAWAAERKDVLSMFFGMAALYSYAFYTQSLKRSRYLMCLVLFVLALMSKPMLVTLPFVFLLLDYWPLKRFEAFAKMTQSPTGAVSTLLIEKIPFFALSAVSCAMTLHAQGEAGADFSLSLRLLNAVVSYAAYITKTLLPLNLAVFYPFNYAIPPQQVIGALLLLTGMTFLAVYYRKSMPFLLIGWLWYAGTLIPVIGLVQVGKQAMADRYTYLPSVGIAIMLAWGCRELAAKFDLKKTLAGAMIAWLVVLSGLSFVYCGYWKNSLALFGHALKVTEDNPVAHVNYATALVLSEGKIDEAIDHYSSAIAIDPFTEMPYYNRGTLYAQKGLYRQALDDFSKVLQLSPDNLQGYNNRGIVFTKMGRYPEALNDFTEAIRLNPEEAQLYENRAAVYLKQKNLKAACADLKKACDLGKCKKLEIARAKGLCR